MRQNPLNSLAILGFPADFRRGPSIGLVVCDRNFMKLWQLVQLPTALPTVILCGHEGILLQSPSTDPHIHVRTRGFEFF